ncbi:MAG: hypothetical protein Q8M70_01765, partial [bacterium]|nr:hypothetical protein [bacterium]
MKLHVALRHIYKLYEGDDSLKDVSVLTDQLESLCNETSKEALDAKRFLWYMGQVNVFESVQRSESIAKGLLDCVALFEQNGLSTEQSLWVITNCIYAMGIDVILPITEHQRINYDSESDQLSFTNQEMTISINDESNPIESLLEQHTLVIYFELGVINKTSPLLLTYPMKKNNFIVRFMNGFWWYLSLWKVTGWQWFLGLFSWIVLILGSVLIPTLILGPIVHTPVLIIVAGVIILGDISYVFIHKFKKIEKIPLLVLISILVQTSLILLFILPMNLYYIILLFNIMSFLIYFSIRYVLDQVQLTTTNPYFAYFMACIALQTIVAVIASTIHSGFIYATMSIIITILCAIGLFFIRSENFTKKTYPDFDQIYSVGMILMVIISFTFVGYIFQYSVLHSSFLLSVSEGILTYMFIYSLVHAVVTLFSFNRGVKQIIITLGVFGLLLPEGALFSLISNQYLSHDVFIATYLLHIFFHAVVLFKRNYDVSALIHVAYGVIIIAIRLFLIG